MGIKKEKTPCKQGFSPRHFFIKRDVLISVYTSAMIKNHSGALLSTLSTRLDGISASPPNHACYYTVCYLILADFNYATTSLP